MPGRHDRRVSLPHLLEARPAATQPALARPVPGMTRPNAASEPVMLPRISKLRMTKTEPIPAAAPARSSCRLLAWVAAAGLVGPLAPCAARGADGPPPAHFSEDVQPVLEQYCYGCHGLGAKKGGVALDAFA